MTPIKWRRINSQNVTKESGVYAWYYEHKLGERDVQCLLDNLEFLDAESERRNLIAGFLDQFVFQQYEETPYEATIRGKLKARYSGMLHHQREVSHALIDRISDRPSIIGELRAVLSEVPHSFASPLYIGMANSLVKRLTIHKQLIEKYRSAGIPAMVGEGNEETLHDHNFAARVVERKFIETNLYVIVKPVKSDHALHTALEHILNRINYPLLGRN